ncbi:hypothetical protein NUSPORA_01851 [Nucleospora cyclopteri]
MFLIQVNQTILFIPMIIKLILIKFIFVTNNDKYEHLFNKTTKNNCLNKYVYKEVVYKQDKNFLENTRLGTFNSLKKFSFLKYIFSSFNNTGILRSYSNYNSIRNQKPKLRTINELHKKIKMDQFLNDNCEIKKSKKYSDNNYYSFKKNLFNNYKKINLENLKNYKNTQTLIKSFSRFEINEYLKKHLVRNISVIKQKCINLSLQQIYLINNYYFKKFKFKTLSIKLYELLAHNYVLKNFLNNKYCTKTIPTKNIKLPYNYLLLDKNKNESTFYFSNIQWVQDALSLGKSKQKNCNIFLKCQSFRNIKSLFCQDKNDTQIIKKHLPSELLSHIDSKNFFLRSFYYQNNTNFLNTNYKNLQLKQLKNNHINNCNFNQQKNFKLNCTLSNNAIFKMLNHKDLFFEKESFFKLLKLFSQNNIYFYNSKLSQHKSIIYNIPLLNDSEIPYNNTLFNYKYANDLNQISVKRSVNIYKNHCSVPNLNSDIFNEKPLSEIEINLEFSETSVYCYKNYMLNLCYGSLVNDDNKDNKSSDSEEDNICEKEIFKPQLNKKLEQKVYQTKQCILIHKSADEITILNQTIDFLNMHWIELEDSKDVQKNFPKGFSFCPGWRKSRLYLKSMFRNKIKDPILLFICKAYSLESYFTLILNMIRINTYSIKNRKISFEVCFHLCCYHFCTVWNLGKGKNIKLGSKIIHYKYINNKNFYKLYKSKEYWIKKAEQIYIKIEKKAINKLGISKTSFTSKHLYNFLLLIPFQNANTVAFVSYVYHATDVLEIDGNLKYFPKDRIDSVIRKRKILLKIAEKYVLYITHARQILYKKNKKRITYE